jgi:hypothetical protein
MKTFTGFEYLLIDAANNYGLDKKLFEERIQWVRDNMDMLESLQDQADNKFRYIKAVMAIRKAQQGIPTGHLVGFDACCSGMQIMSAITGCFNGAEATGLVNPNVRSDAYTKVTNKMIEILQGLLIISRDDAKQAVMTSLYGSKAKPKEIFGEDTPELNAFYKAMQIVAPGAWELLQDLLDSWQPYALVHEWKLPDGFDARVKVMLPAEARIEVDELDHATFTYQWKENAGSKKGLSNVANVVHSIDAYVLRCLVRRCNYNKPMVESAHIAMIEALIYKSLNPAIATATTEGKHRYYVEQYERSRMPDVVILPYLTTEVAKELSVEHLNALIDLVQQMLEYQPFEVVSVHDEFQCHANNMNYLRQQYANILADLADSEILSDILSQLHGSKGTYPKATKDLSKYIRNSNYALS